MNTPTFTPGLIPRRGLNNRAMFVWLSQVAGKRCGPFGIHKTVSHPHEWNLTHCPSGYGLGKFKRQQEAKEAVARLLALNIDWGFRNPIRLTKIKRKAILAAVRTPQQRPAGRSL